MILEKELALVKKQLLKKTVEEEVHVPTKDLQDDEACGNEMIKQKMKKLYDEISDKAKKISELKSELEDIYGQNEKKTFELKK